MSYEEQCSWQSAYYAPLQQARITKWRAELTEEELDEMTPWGLLPIDKMIKLGLANLINKLLKR